MPLSPLYLPGSFAALAIFSLSKMQIDLVTKLEGSRAKGIKVIRGRGEGTAWTAGGEEIAFGPSFGRRS